MNRIASLVVPAILLGILAAGSLIIVLIVGAAPPPKPVRITAVLKTMDSDMEFWEVVKAGMSTAAKESNASLEILGPPMESDVAGQIAIMDHVLSGPPPSVLILSATDFNELAPSMERARAAGIPVITIDSDVNSAIPLSFVATNNIEAGGKAGREMIRLLPTGRPVALVNHIKGATTAMEREEGALRALEADGRFPIVGVFYTNNFEARAYAIARELLATHPDLGGILALNEVSTLGVARALKDEGRSGAVKLVGFDSSISEIKLIEEGVIQATVSQQPFNMGYLSVRAAKDAVDGKKVADFIDTGSILITPENMYLPENQKILFPFVDSAAR